MTMIDLPAEGGSLSPRATKPDYKIVQREYDTPCWEWQKNHLRGYGRGSFTSLGIDTQWAHRAYYIAVHGPIPAGLSEGVIDHLCRNPICVNPAHLEYVPAATNVRRGDLAKLSEPAIEEIKARLRHVEPLGDIARDFDVHENTIWHIANGWTWGPTGFGPGGEIIRPEVHCLECGSLITTGQRHKKFCCASHRGKYNSRHRWRRIHGATA